MYFQYLSSAYVPQYVPCDPIKTYHWHMGLLLSAIYRGKVLKGLPTWNHDKYIFLQIWIMTFNSFSNFLLDICIFQHAKHPVFSLGSILQNKGSVLLNIVLSERGILRINSSILKDNTEENLRRATRSNSALLLPGVLSGEGLFLFVHSLTPPYTDRGCSSLFIPEIFM